MSEDERERRFPTSDLWLTAFPPQIVTMPGNTLIQMAKTWM